MASLVLRDGRYYAQFCDGGRKPRLKRIALGTSAKGAARKLGFTR